MAIEKWPFFLANLKMIDIRPLDHFLWNIFK